MRCSLSISAEQLARFWLDEISEEEAIDLEDHVFQCDACDASLRRFAAIGQGIRVSHAMERLPPLLTSEQLAALRARGMRLEVEHLSPGAVSKRLVDPSLDGLVWVLHADLSAAARVDLEICSPEGLRLVLLPGAPLDRETGGVILACARHTAEVVPESCIRLRDGQQGTLLAEYRLMHWAVKTL